ncbi:MAG: hypothetical protein AAFZ65_01360, partial [Planctomycetota bacterium]
MSTTPLTLFAALALTSLAGAQERTASTAPEHAQPVHNLDARAERALAAELQEFDGDSIRWRANSHLLGGSPISIGSRYKATYSRAGVRFTPALGKHAPETRNLQFRFEGVRVGPQAVEGLDLDAKPQLVGDSVHFDRGGVLETYHATEAGLKQSFVFDSLPSRAGDLVVHGRLSVEMQRVLEEASSNSLVFREAGHGDVRLDTVVGIDGQGREAMGSLSLDGDRLELVLPADFIASAELPLVLDPLFGVELQGSQPAFDSNQCDVAAGEN